MLNRAARGMSLIELMIALAILAVLLALALPEYNTFIRNTKVKNLALSLEAGLQLARTEAIRRNENVRFQIVSDLTSGCTVAGTEVSTPHWVVSRDDPTGRCDAAPSDSVPPMIVQKWDFQEGAAGSGLAWNLALAGTASALVTFNGLGRVTPPPAGAITIEVRPVETSGIACAPAGSVRCLRVTVSPAGQIRTCDPAMTVATDPRYC
ncbi:MAG: GspH/FimT family protein [Burkholderiales bacterium]|nr:GspH/FimT family protein [Burkholderiales bacterium]